MEVDGAQHGMGAQVAYDARRDAALAKAGFLTLRFWNSDVNEDIDVVVETVFARAMEREKHSCIGADPTRPAARATLPMKGREGRAIVSCDTSKESP